MHKRRLIVLLAAVLVIAAGGYYGIYRFAKPSVQIEKITFGSSVGLLETTVWIARNKGYFQDEGVEVTIETFPSGRAAFLAMLGGKPLDIVSVAPLPIAVESLRRNDFRLITGIAHSLENYKLIANRERGIAAIADLKGKKVGLPAGSSAQFFLELALLFNRIPLREVEMVDLKPSDLPAALANNQVDAISIWEPYAYMAKTLLAAKAIRLTPPGAIRATLNLVAMQHVTQNRAEAIRRFLRAIDRAAAFARENKEDTAAIVSKLINLDKEPTAMLLSEYTQGLFLDQGLIASIEDEARWAIESKLTDTTVVPNYLDFIYFAGLRSVKPSTITITGRR